MTAQVMFMNEPVENFAPIEIQGDNILGTGSLWQRVEERGENLEVSGTWLVYFVNQCTCYGGGPYGHEPGCGYEPVRNLSDILAARESYQPSEDFVLRKACPGL